MVRILHIVHIVITHGASLDEHVPMHVVHQNRPSRTHRFRALLRRLGPAGPLAIVSTILPPIGAIATIGLLTMLGPKLREEPWAPFAVCLAFILLGGLSLLPPYAVSILAGWAFGFAVGFPTAWVAMVGAALVSYAIARRTAGTRLVQMIDEKPTWRAVHAALVGRGFWHAVWVVVLLRTAPIPPFSLSNLLMGAAHVRLSRYIVGTILGMASHAAVVSLSAAKLHELSFRKAGDQPWLIVGGIVALLVVVGLIGRVARRALDAAVAHDAMP